MGLSQGFGGGAPNELETECWRQAERERGRAEGTGRKLVLYIKAQRCFDPRLSD